MTTQPKTPTPSMDRKRCPFCGIAVPFVQDPNTGFIDSSWMEHPNNGCRIGRRMYIPEWNTRPLDLPSSCSLSHPEIRYQGETCPLCEAQSQADSWRKNYRELRNMLDEKQSARIAKSKATKALSRPSSDPGAGEVGK